MGKFYRGGFRKISSAEYGRYYGGKSRTDMAARITLAHACAKNSWLPARVGIGGTIIEAGGWSGVFLAVSKFLIGRHETAVQTFVDEMAVSWIGKGKCGMKMPLPVCGEWFVDGGVGDGVLISRLKLLVTAVGINPNEVIVSSVADVGKLDVVVKKKPVVEKDDSPAPVLDSDQEAFVKSDARNARLLAPAGAGKTLTILHRCKELVNRQKTNKILLVTFTRAARDELKLRIATRKEFEDLDERVVVTTLNQYGFKLLKKNWVAD